MYKLLCIKYHYSYKSQYTITKNLKKGSSVRSSSTGTTIVYDMASSVATVYPTALR